MERLINNIPSAGTDEESKVVHQLLFPFANRPFDGGLQPLPVPRSACVIFRHVILGEAPGDELEQRHHIGHGHSRVWVVPGWQRMWQWGSNPPVVDLELNNDIVVAMKFEVVVVEEQVLEKGQL